MSKEITKAYILQQMQDKFALRALETEIFRFSEEVIPVYNVEQHLLEQRAAYSEVGITSTGAENFFVVPATERWILSRYDVVFMGAGAYTVAGLYTRRQRDLENVYLDLTAGQTVSYHVHLPSPVILDPRDTLSVNIDGYTSPQNLRVYIDYTRETIR